MLFDSFDVVCSGLRPHAVLAEVWRFIETQLFFQKSNNDQWYSVYVLDKESHETQGAKLDGKTEAVCC